MYMYMYVRINQLDTHVHVHVRINQLDTHVHVHVRINQLDTHVHADVQISLYAYMLPKTLIHATACTEAYTCTCMYDTGTIDNILLSSLMSHQYTLCTCTYNVPVISSVPADS